MMPLKVLLLTLAFGLAAYWLKPAPKLCIVNLHKALEQPAHLLIKSQYSKTQQKEILKRFSRHLLPVIQRYAKDHQQTVIDAKTLADDGQIDITDEIVKLTLEAIKHEQ